LVFLVFCLGFLFWVDELTSNRRRYAETMSQGTKEKKKEGQGGRKEIELAPAYLQDFLTSPPCTSFFFLAP
jgi:hypothetical protein